MENEHKKSAFLHWFRSKAIFDGLALFFITALGWFLIGWYQQGNYLETGYPDWIYHAARIQSLREHGFVSWDHMFSNGINFWRLYQYIFHFFILWASELLHLEIPKTMLWSTIVTFIGARFVMYGVLRRLRTDIVPALLASVASYSFTQQWMAISDFSLFPPMILIPLIIGLWISSLKNSQLVFLFAAVTGVSFMFHPIIGFGLFFLFLITLALYQPRFSFLNTLCLFLIFALGSAPFWVEYISIGYSYSNPFFASTQFLRQAIKSEYLGMGLEFMMLFAASWMLVIFQTSMIPRWSKLLLLYCSVLIAIVYLGLLGDLPAFLRSMQLSRAMTMLGFILPFCFAMSFQAIVKIYPSRFTYTLLTLLLALSITTSIGVATRWSGQPIMQVTNPVAEYFSDRPSPIGSVFVDDESEASYFTRHGIRFATSYNEHLEAHPLSQRLSSLLKNDLLYTGITDKQKNLVNAYSQVLGVEYLFLEKTSPLASALTATSSGSTFFREESTIATKDNLWSVLKITTPIANAYMGDGNNPQQVSLLSFSKIPKPTLFASSFLPWDQAIQELADGLSSQKVTPLNIEFMNSDTLKIQVATSSSSPKSNRFLLVTQSYDKNWRVENHPEIAIRPTSLRFMYIALPDSFTDSSIVLVNKWPFWRWPVQAMGPITVTIVCLGILFKKLMKLMTHRKKG